MSSNETSDQIQTQACAPTAPARKITSHQINECNRAIQIRADEPDASAGNASHTYVLAWLQNDGFLWPSTGHAQLTFQRGPIAAVGTNGITHEALLAVLIDRLEGFQSGKFANAYNGTALECLRAAVAALNARTRERTDRGVEGTLEV